MAQAIPMMPPASLALPNLNRAEKAWLKQKEL
jgi:hypothetical protein